MPDVLIRRLAPDVIEALKASAAANGRSLQAEMHHILATASRRNLAATRRVSSRWLKQLAGRDHADSAELVRESRDIR